MYEKEIVKLIKELPVDLRIKVLDYIELLLKKNKKTDKKLNKNNFRFDWEDGLSEIKDEFTSIELQHRSLEWR
ncbi:MAG: hypothetical protein CVU88_01655 [Firmicutes bacterium HGW-Firmicutes-13]|nr:MAG: hypothetical protein CVU88_01655 [Firmicutes bacterium HGW-Firmicutes-13]